MYVYIYLHTGEVVLVNRVIIPLTFNATFNDNTPQYDEMRCEIKVYWPELCFVYLFTYKSYIPNNNIKFVIPSYIFFHQVSKPRPGSSIEPYKKKTTQLYYRERAVCYLPYVKLKIYYTYKTYLITQWLNNKINVLTCKTYGATLLVSCFSPMSWDALCAKGKGVSVKISFTTLNLIISPEID